jgi:glutathione S-transferase
MRTLYGLEQSAWTERARWALDHHGLVYTFHEHVPMLGELLLRRKAGTKKATVPLLEDGSVIVMGSLAIARHTEAAGRGAPLFPRHKDAEIDHWADIAERMTRVGRAWFLKHLLENKDVQKETLPSFMPKAMRGLLAPSAAMGTRFLMKKHDVPTDVEAEVEYTLVPLLQELRAKLEAGPTLVGGAFSYADLAIATALHVVRPHTSAKIGPASREAWTNEAVAARFSELLEWRDAVYGKYR